MTLGVIGGTFDPIHCGHVAAAVAAERALKLRSMMLIPSRLPPHRPEQARVGPLHRLAMTTLAAADHRSWSVSDLELKREGPSYTFDTLTELIGQGHSASQIFFITGADAFAEIATWSRYPAVLDLAHFVVVARPGITLDSLKKRLPDLAERMTTPASLEPKTSSDKPQPGPQRGSRAGVEASSPKPNERTRIILIEAATPDVSSTDIRRRLNAGVSIDGLVPVFVGTYIAHHRLYVEAGL